MRDLSTIDEYYKKFIKDLHFWIPEGIYFVNLELLHHFDLLHFQPIGIHRKDPLMTRYFHIFETPEKITLINDEFVVWIVPDRMDQTPLTHVLIALNSEEGELQLEVAFIATGVYNTSRLVLKVLEKFLIEIQETEKALFGFQEMA